MRPKAAKAPIPFPSLELDLDGEQLRRGSRMIPLRPKAFAVLRYLVEHPQRVVSKEELLQVVWPGTVVTEAQLKNRVLEVRKALGDDAQTPRYIEAVPRRGYRFIGHLPTTSQAVVSGQSPVAEESEEGKRKAKSKNQEALGGVPLLAPSTQHPAPLLVGRETALRHLQGWLEKALQGEHQVVFITGEAGIGKTTVLNAFLATLAKREDLLVACGQCVEHFGAGEAYLPLLTALGQVGSGSEGERTREVLRRHGPTWLLQLPALVATEELLTLQLKTQGATRERMLRELAEALEALTIERPLVLALEDLHWSDHSTLETLVFLARRIQPARLLVVATHRPVVTVAPEHPLRTLWQGLRLHQHCEELPLTLLTEQEVTRYVRARVAAPVETQAPFTHLAHALYVRTEGNPLFLTAVVDGLAGQGVLERLSQDDTPSPLSGRVEIGLGIETPPTLQQMIEQQCNRLASEHQRLLEVASTVGIEFSAAAVARILALSTAEVEEQCVGLIRRGYFVRESGLDTWPDGTVATRFQFQHSLYRDVLYQRITAGQRVRWHQQIGELLERSYGPRALELASILAVHFERGQDIARAVHYRQLAGNNALRQRGYREAAEHLTRGLALLMTQPDTPERTQQELPLQMTLGVVLMATKGFSVPEIEQVYGRARALCQQLGDTPQLFPALYGLWSFHLTRTELSMAHILGAQLLRLAQSSQDTTLLLQAHQALGITLYFQGELLAAHEHLQQSLALYDHSQHRSLAFVYGHDPGVVCFSYMMRILWLLGYPEQALQRSRAGVVLAREFMFAPSLASALYFTSTVHNWRREWPAAQQCAEEVLTLATEQGLPYWVALVTVGRGWAFVRHGRAEEGSAHLRQAIDTLTAMGATLGRSSFMCVLAEAYGKVGRVEEGLTVVAEALEFVTTTGERWYEAEVYRLKGELLLQRGRHGG